jgi:hypothetical protein
MTKATRQLDFTAAEAKARTMTDEQLNAALADIHATLPTADANDRENGTTEGGYYRDEASVVRLELWRRSPAAEAEAKRNPLEALPSSAPTAFSEYACRLVAAVAVKNAIAELERAAKALEGLGSIHNSPAAVALDSFAAGLKIDGRALFFAAVDRRRAAAEFLGPVESVLDMVEATIHGSRS